MRDATLNYELRLKLAMQQWQAVSALITVRAVSFVRYDSDVPTVCFRRQITF